MIGGEARAFGFNVMLGGAVNLMREPRAGARFEDAGEDPLLAGTIVGAEIAGVQSNAIIDTVKHYALNDQETDRGGGNFQIDEAGLAHERPAGVRIRHRARQSRLGDVQLQPRERGPGLRKPVPADASAAQRMGLAWL